MRVKSFSNKRILIVDDDRVLHESTREALNTQGFFNIDGAYTYEEGIQKIETGTVDLVILDIMLPDGNGYDLATYVREFSDIPILFLTAKDTADDEVKGLMVGGDDYLTKPFLPKMLVARVQSLLRRAYLNEKRIVELPDRVIDFDKAVVIHGQEIMRISPTELKVLEALMHRPNQIISVDSLCQSVWGINHFGQENSLMVHIRRLREKIEQDPSNPEVILTLKGLGYRLALDEGGL
ncbi:DNA-binding response regulator [Lactobacillus amylophilus DSM = JCM 1125] [Dolosigranulum pigrum]|uniref:response regulator transcription factor n=1 Tax=Dolosigranulum pigrum TaxID=29394 RepID=UPI000DBFC610|nr:response regulator transcription factor [Dolosigranulum pigrum]RAN58048.1 DNA-binding response regulator [Dolosigranulum pigrum]VTU65067.1 DNA-binding response regulator [Lactobacillus amylophilus DSM = JCM 1125] [Dolosigranulum pigrum]